MNFLFVLANMQRSVRAYADKQGPRATALPRAMGGSGQGGAHEGLKQSGTGRT